MAEKTLFRLSIQHQDRWSTFDAGSGIVFLSEKLSAAQMQEYEIFKEFRESFLERISPDVTVATWKKGSVLFEEGSYIDLAFFVLEGEVELCLKAGQGQAQASSPIFETQRTMPNIQAVDSAQDETPEVEKTVYFSKTQLQDSNQIAFLSSLDFDLPPGDVMRLGKGEFFGEIGALNGWPQSVTAQTASDCVLIQIRVPALRRMKEKSTEFKKRIDTLYRKRSLFRQLKASPLFSSCSDNFLVGLAKKVKLVSCQPDEAVVKEGSRADSLYLVRSGFVKISRQLGEGQQVLSYLSKGMSFGEAELLFPELENWTCSYFSVGYSELVQFSSSDLHKAVKVHPEIESGLWEQAASRIKASDRRDLHQSEFIQFALEKGLVEGNSVLVIDLDNCTRCDDCVRACADTHGGRPRFVREGDRYANLLIAKACYHCQDPVCLIGCPTGAIRRANVGEVVEIRDDICIGCSNCADNCPYDAIVMHDTETTWGQDAVPKSLRGQPRLLASKCDLCYTSDSGPACVRNCPQGCAYRVGSIEEFRQLLDGRD